ATIPGQTGIMPTPALGLLNQLFIPRAKHPTMGGRKHPPAPPGAGPVRATPMTDNIDFETALNELDAIVHKMEDGQLGLEQSLEAFEQGIMLTRQCQQALTSAEQRVQMLIDKDGEAQTKAFSADE